MSSSGDWDDGFGGGHSDFSWYSWPRSSRSRRKKIPSEPIETSHGIKAISQKGKFCTEWWALRWIQIIESYRLGARLTRGKRYARWGQVLSIDFSPGLIFAEVQGSCSLPYEICIKLLVWSEEEWSRLVSWIQARPVILSQLFSNSLPPSLEEDIRPLGLSLFPEQFTEFSTECTCPDWSNPCKHIAAVFYLIAEVLEKNPFLLFELRGKDKESFLTLLLPQESQAVEADLAGGTEALSMEHFWKGASGEAEVAYYPEEITQSASIIHQMGPFPMWQGNQDFFSFWEKQYELYTRLALEDLALI